MCSGPEYVAAMMRCGEEWTWSWCARNGAVCEYYSECGIQVPTTRHMLYQQCIAPKPPSRRRCHRMNSLRAPHSEPDEIIKAVFDVGSTIAARTHGRASVGGPLLTRGDFWWYVGTTRVSEPSCMQPRTTPLRRLRAAI